MNKAKGIVLLLSIFMVILTGCSKEKETSEPDYFKPIIQEVEASGVDAVNTIFTWFDKGLSNSEEYADEYQDKVYKFYLTEKGETYSFDLHDYLTSAEEWNWLTAGVFQNEEKFDIFLYDFNASYEDETSHDIQLLLIEFNPKDAEQFQVWTYSVEPKHLFAWLDFCNGLQDEIYLAGEKDLAAIDLNTKELKYCKDEYELTEKYVQENFDSDKYHMFFFRALSKQNNVTIYSAQVSEANDEPPVGMVFMAYQVDQPIAYMCVDFIADKENRIKIDN